MFFIYEVSTKGRIYTYIYIYIYIIYIYIRPPSRSAIIVSIRYLAATTPVMFIMLDILKRTQYNKVLRKASHAGHMQTLNNQSKYQGMDMYSHLEKRCSPQTV